MELQMTDAYALPQRFSDWLGTAYDLLTKYRAPLPDVAVLCCQLVLHAFWFIPLYLVSLLLSSIWFQDIATKTFRHCHDSKAPSRNPLHVIRCSKRR